MTHAHAHGMGHDMDGRGRVYAPGNANMIQPKVGGREAGELNVLLYQGDFVRRVVFDDEGGGE